MTNQSQDWCEQQDQADRDDRSAARIELRERFAPGPRSAETQIELARLKQLASDKLMDATHWGFIVETTESFVDRVEAHLGKSAIERIDYTAEQKALWRKLRSQVLSVKQAAQVEHDRCCEEARRCEEQLELVRRNAG